MSKTHILKCVNPYFQELENGNKTFELRKNDRNFQLEDIIILREYFPETYSYSGREHSLSIEFIQSYSILYPIALKEGYLILAEEFDFDIIHVDDIPTFESTIGKKIVDSHGYIREISYVL